MVQIKTEETDDDDLNATLKPEDIEDDDEGEEENDNDDSQSHQSPVNNNSKSYNIVKTPCKAKRSLLNGTPRTPTPFKNALAELGKRRSEMYVPPSPAGLVEDIAEIMHKERLHDSVYDTDSSVLTQKRNESLIADDIKKIEGGADETEQKKEGQPTNGSGSSGCGSSGGSNKKVRKSLESTWDLSADMPYLAETPVSSDYENF